VKVFLFLSKVRPFCTEIINIFLVLSFQINQLHSHVYFKILTPSKQDKHPQHSYSKIRRGIYSLKT